MPSERYGNAYGHLFMCLSEFLQEFRTSTKPIPQPFYLQIYSNLNIPQSEEQNTQTDETLTTMPNRQFVFFVEKGGTTNTVCKS
jgi:hypothetical protein